MTRGAWGVPGPAQPEAQTPLGAQSRFRARAVGPHAVPAPQLTACAPVACCSPGRPRAPHASAAAAAAAALLPALERALAPLLTARAMGLASASSATSELPPTQQDVYKTAELKDVEKGASMPHPSQGPFMHLCQAPPRARSCASNDAPLVPQAVLRWRPAFRRPTRRRQRWEKPQRHRRLRRPTSAPPPGGCWLCCPGARARCLRWRWWPSCCARCSASCRPSSLHSSVSLLRVLASAR
jgi:hypothetical protein